MPLPAVLGTKAVPPATLNRESRFEQEVKAIKDFYRADIER